MRFWKILRGLQTVGQNLKAGPVLKFAFFEYENFQRYRQFCLLTGLKFALNYQNKILFLLRRGRILFKVKIKILKKFKFRCRYILNGFCTFIASTKSSVDPCFVPNFSPDEETG